MSTRRMARVASMIREVVSSAILFELRDPRIRNVTVLGAEVSPDLRYAAVRVSVLGDEKVAALTLHGLNSARGYLQSKVAEHIKSRYTPELRFILDEGIRKSMQTAEVLRSLQQQENSGVAVPGPHGSGTTDSDDEESALTDSLESEPEGHPDPADTESE